MGSQLQASYCNPAHTETRPSPYSDVCVHTAHTCAHSHAHMQTCTHTICISTYILGDVHVYAAHIHTHPQTCLSTYSYTYTCEHTHMYTYTNLCAHIIHVHIYAHTLHINTHCTYMCMQTCVYTRHRKECWTAPVGSLLNRRKEWVVTWEDTRLGVPGVCCGSGSL